MRICYLTFIVIFQYSEWGSVYLREILNGGNLELICFTWHQLN
jgi:hypothetical protein